jgi:predicted deacylase
MMVSHSPRTNTRYMGTLTIGTAASRRGEKVSGFIELAAHSGNPAIRIPVSIVQGTRDGPVLALVAGIHGSEPSPILALHRVRATLDPPALAGTVVIVHVANVPSFVHRTVYRGPWDFRNLNRVFPGRADGSASERIAHAITTEVIEQCDFLVDMHSGDGNEDLRPYSYWNALGADAGVDETARGMALAFGLDHIVIDRGRPRDPERSVFCANTAHARGKPAITTEAGAVGVPTADAIERNVQGAFGVMQYLGMRSGTAPAVNAIWLDPSVVLTSPATGVWLPAVRSDQHVAEGDVLGQIVDYFGDPIATMRSPLAGIVLYVVASPAMTEGEPIAMVGCPAPASAARIDGDSLRPGNAL